MNSKRGDVRVILLTSAFTIYIWKSCVLPAHVLGVSTPCQSTN